MLDRDDASAAARQTGGWAEDRVRQWWDGTREMSQRVARTLDLQGPAWDVYLLYRPGIRWEGPVLPVPSFWMHQLDDPAADPDLCLSRDPSRLAAELTSLLEE